MKRVSIGMCCCDDWVMGSMCAMCQQQGSMCVNCFYFIYVEYHSLVFQQGWQVGNADQEKSCYCLFAEVFSHEV